MRYEKQSVLTRDENPNGGTDCDVKPFERGTEPVLRWMTEGDQYGCEDHSLYPARARDGNCWCYCWYHTWLWRAGDGYRAEGYGSELLPFDDGIKILRDPQILKLRTPPEGTGRRTEKTIAEGIKASGYRPWLLDDPQDTPDVDQPGLHVEAKRPGRKYATRLLESLKER